MATTKATTLAHTLGGISSDISAAEINKLNGVTGDNIQTQLNSKITTSAANANYAPKAGPEFSGNVGIGGTGQTDTGGLTITSTGSNGARCYLGATGTGTADIVLDASNGDFAGSDYYMLRQLNDLNVEHWLGTSGDFVFRTNAGTERMRITNAGYTTFPVASKPSWFITNSTSDSAFSANSVATWDVRSSNGRFVQGGCTYSSGAITVPVSGLYHISCMILSNSDARLFFHMRVDGVGQGGTYIETYDTGTLFQTATLIITLNLSANQTVDIKTTTSSAYGGSYANFNGFFIG